MRTLCAILLFGVVTYVQAYHACARFAVKVKQSPIQDSSTNATSLSLQEFFNKITGVFYVDKTTLEEEIPKEATSDEMQDDEMSDDEMPDVEMPDAEKYCIPGSYSTEVCGGIQYATKYLEGQSAIQRNLLTGKVFETTIISFTFMYSIKYKITFAGVDPYNYIFKLIDNTPIDVQKLPEHTISSQVPIQPPPEIQDLLASEFALFSYQPGPEGYNLFVTCDGTAAWATYRKGINPTAAMNHALRADIVKLEQKIWRKFRREIHLHTTDKYFDSNLSEYLRTLYNNN